MSIRLLSAVLGVLLVPAFAAAQEKKATEENPFKRAKVGDWATYTLTMNPPGGMKIEGTTKVLVTATDDKNVTLKTTVSVGGKDFPATESKVDLTKPYDPLGSTTTLPKGADVKVEKTGDGKEKLKLGGKEYDSTWMKLKVKATVNDKSVEMEAKVWSSKDVPLGGTVKLEIKSEQGEMMMELKETGTGGK